jgi:hypothetical protein
MSGQMGAALYKLLSAGLNLGRIFNSRSGYTHDMHLQRSTTKRPSLELKLGPNNF